MASPEVLDFGKLMAPIPGPNPSGVDLRGDLTSESKGRDLYDKIRNNRITARELERAASRNGKPEPGGKGPDWQVVRDDVTKALVERSKDLELTVYLIEALVRLNGFAGLRDGFRLVRELTDKYWDSIYPLPEKPAGPEDPTNPASYEDRMGPLISLNGESRPGTLIPPIQWIPITGQTGVGRFTALDYMEAEAIDKLADPKERERKIAEGVATLEKVRNAVGETDAKFYQELMQDLDGCDKELSALNKSLSARKIPGGFASSNIKAEIESCRDRIRRLAGSKLAPPPPPPKPDGNGAPPVKAPSPPGTIDSREDAVATLRRVADYFRKNEPHTPVHFAVDQAAKWAEMKLPELLVELIPEEAARKNLFKLVGIEPPSAKK